MKRGAKSETEAALRSAFARLTDTGRETLVRAVGAKDGTDAARIIAKPGWARTATEGLTTRARTGLRILIHSPRGVSSTELDSLLAAIPAIDEGVEMATEQLVASGLVTISVERVFNKREERLLSAIDPLRGQLDTLLRPDESNLLPAPSIAADEFVLHRFELQVGVLLAHVEQTRPRVTRFMDLHRADGKALSEQLATLFGEHDEVVQLLNRLSRTGDVVIDDGRLRMQLAKADELPVVTRLLLKRVSERGASSIFRVLLGALLTGRQWVAESSLVEIGGLAALASAGGGDCLHRVRQELIELKRTPGVVVSRVESNAYWRVTDAARAALEGRKIRKTLAPKGLLVQPNFQIVASPGLPSMVLAGLGRICRLVSVDQVAIFALDEATIRRSASEGWATNDLLALLEEHATHGVPPTVVRALSDWSQARGTVRLTVGTILMTDLPVEEVRRIVGPRYEIAQLAKGLLHADVTAATAVSAALRKAGVVCRSFDAEDPKTDRRIVDTEPPKKQPSQPSLAASLKKEAMLIQQVPKG